MVVGKGRLLTDGLNRQCPKSKFLSVTHSLMSVYSEANGTPNRTSEVIRQGFGTELKVFRAGLTDALRRCVPPPIEKRATNPKLNSHEAF
jgi:hypothetical protein